MGFNIDEGVEEYISRYEIVSDKERETILKHWNEIQYKNELQFEQEYMESIANKRRLEENKCEEDEEEM